VAYCTKISCTALFRLVWHLSQLLTFALYTILHINVVYCRHSIFINAYDTSHLVV